MNIGIIGTGSIAHILTNAIANTDGANLYAVASRTLEKAKSFADEFAGRFDNKIKTYGSYEDLYCDPEVDIVYISTPHGRHYKDAKDALEHGKNVLCEKAFTVNSAEAEKLINLAREKNLFLCEAMWPRFNPVTKKVNEWLKADRIGKIIGVSANFGFIARVGYDHRLFAVDCGGGALLDVGVYALAFISLAFGGKIPEKVSASSLYLENGVDSYTAALLDYGGAVAQMTCSFTADMPPKGTIYGEKGKIEIEDIYISPKRAILKDYSNSGNEIFEPENMKGGYEYEVEAVCEAVRNGKKECEEITLNETLSVMRTVDMIKQQIGLKYPNDIDL